VDKFQERRINIYLKEADKDIDNFIASFLRVKSYQRKLAKLDDGTYQNQIQDLSEKLNKKLKVVKKYYEVF
jgi:hypothetical protein